MANNDVQTSTELINWALNWPPDPDVSKGSGSEAERFAAVLPETVWQVDHIHRMLEGNIDPRRPPWWTLKDDAKKADVFKRALARVKYERSIRREKADGPWLDAQWQDVLRVAIERAALSPTRGQGMVRDALRANLVRYVAVATGLKVSRGRESSPPYRTACDAVALAEAVWETGSQAGHDVAVLMLELLTDTPELSAAAEEDATRKTPTVVTIAKKQADRIVAELDNAKTAAEVEHIFGREYKSGVRELEAWLEEWADSASPLPSAARILQVWNEEDRVSRATAADVEKAVVGLKRWRFVLPEEAGLPKATWEKALNQLAWLRKEIDAGRSPRPWHAATVEKGLKRLE